MLFKRKRRRSDLDDVLGSWSDADPFTVRQATQSVAIFGKTGSGKSSGSGDYLLRCLVRYRNSGGLILASKPEDKNYVIRLFQQERTLDDLIILEPGGQHRFNILDYEMKRGADTLQLTQMLLILAETLDRVDGGGEQSRDPFWKAKNREGLNHAIEIVTRATGELDPWDIQCFISGAALSLQELDDSKWKTSFHNKALDAAERNARTDIQKHDHQAARQHWTSAWPRLNDRTRSSVEAGLFSLLNTLNTGIVRDLLATTTTVTPKDLEQRKWWLVNMPIVPGDASATMVNTAVKLAVERHILRRHPGQGDPLLCVYCDEFTKVANSYDSHTLNEIRSHKGCLVTLTQSLPGMYAAMGGKGGEHITNALLSQYGHIVFHTSDALTARFASDMLGQRLEMMVGGGPREATDDFDMLLGRTPLAPNFNHHYQPVLQPHAFMSGLRSGGQENGNIVDGIVIRPGRPFNWGGENHLMVSFRQY